jgi:hypothetical protein
MKNNISHNILQTGKWSAILSAVCSLIYVIGQLAEWLGLLGSGGGPENASTVTGLILLLTPSLFLGICFLVLMVSIHYYAPEESKLWSHIGLVFATIYTALISINYFVQLTLVVPHMQAGETESVKFLLFIPFDSFLYSVDILGYSFMSLATFFTGFVFKNKGSEKYIRFFLIANGLILPFIALQNFYHPLIYPAALWAFTFPGATITLAILFNTELKRVDKPVYSL